MHVVGMPESEEGVQVSKDTDSFVTDEKLAELIAKTDGKYTSMALRELRALRAGVPETLIAIKEHYDARSELHTESNPFDSWVYDHVCAALASRPAPVGSGNVPDDMKEAVALLRELGEGPITKEHMQRRNVLLAKHPMTD